MTVRERESPQKSEHEQTFWCKVDRAGTEKKLIRPDYVNDCHEKSNSPSACCDISVENSVQTEMTKFLLKCTLSLHSPVFLILIRFFTSACIANTFAIFLLLRHLNRNNPILFWIRSSVFQLDSSDCFLVVHQPM